MWGYNLRYEKWRLVPPSYAATLIRLQPAIAVGANLQGVTNTVSDNQKRMKITIKITEEDAACIWADATWDGKYTMTVAEILTRKAERQAEMYRHEFRGGIKKAVQDFRKSNQATE